MPPHCDAMDGPVVLAAMHALDARDVEIVLPFVDAQGDAEIRRAFDEAVGVRSQGEQAKRLADRSFFETVVRVHRAGEGAPFTGLKPAGLDHGPAIPIAERAIENGSPEELSRLLGDALEHQVKSRLDHVMVLKGHTGEGLPQARAYTAAMLSLQVWANRVYEVLNADPHEEHGAYERHEG